MVNIRHRVGRIACLLALFAAVLSGCSVDPEAGVGRIDPLIHDDDVVVTLPKLWSMNEAMPSRLEGTFQLTAFPRSLAIYQAHSTLPFRASVNGSFVYQSGDQNSWPINGSSHRSTVVFRVPQEWLRLGENHLTIQLYEPDRSHARLLGVFYVGEADAVERLAFRRWLGFHLGPVAVGVLLLAIGMVALGLWAGRRDKDLFMLMAAGCLLWALQIAMYQWPTPVLPSPHRYVFLIAMYAWWPVLIAVFFLRFANRQSQILESCAAALAIIAAPLLYAGNRFGLDAEASIALRARTRLHRHWPVRDRALCTGTAHPNGICAAFRKRSWRRRGVPRLLPDAGPGH